MKHNFSSHKKKINIVTNLRIIVILHFFVCVITFRDLMFRDFTFRCSTFRNCTVLTVITFRKYTFRNIALFFYFPGSYVPELYFRGKYNPHIYQYLHSRFLSSAYIKLLLYPFIVLASLFKSIYIRRVRSDNTFLFTKFRNSLSVNVSFITYKKHKYFHICFSIL